MAIQKVLLLGATGETGGDILDGLLEDGNFDVACLVQPSSANKPSVQALRDRGLPIVIGNLSGSVEDLAKVIRGYETVISAIGPLAQIAQLSLVDAIALAGTVKRFVPCAFITVCPPGGIMRIRDDKEIVYQRMWINKVPYTIIDVGYWHQVSWFRVPSGKLDYALLVSKNELYHDGEAKTMLTDKRDIGRFVARIVKDERTINQKLFTYSDVISQNEIVEIIERKTGEKVEYTKVSKEDLSRRLASARAAVDSSTTSNVIDDLARSQVEYSTSKYIRQDNTPEYGKYLGYLDARELYPDFKPIRFETFVDELVAGKVERPYPAMAEAIKEGFLNVQS